jgi:hypothetical protein
MKLLLPVLLLASTAGAQTARFELAPEAPTALIGAPVEISGTAAFPSRFSLQTGLTGQDTGAFEIVSVEAGAPRTEGALASVPVRLKVAVFALGEVTLPALNWTLRAADGSESVLQSPPVRLKITGPKVEEGADIRDIAGPFAVRVWPWLLLAALAAAGLLAWGWRAAARRRQGGLAEPAAPPDNRTPDEIALDELRQLAGLELPVKEYYDRISDILRLYLERRYELPALRMTTGDLTRRLAGTPATVEARGMTRNLLERCDLVKFARYLPADEDRRKDVNSAGHIVVLTRPPKPETLTPGQAEPAAGGPPA